MSPPSRAARRRLTTPRLWALGLGAAVAVSLAAAAWSRSWSGGGLDERLRIAFGIAAAALLLVTSAYGVRRRAMALATRRRLGGARAWLQLHQHGGLLFLLLVALHGGLAGPDNVLSAGMWALSLWLAASGLAGALLQRWVPRQLASGLSLEVHYDRIPELVSELRARAEKLAADAPEPVRDLYYRIVEPELAVPRRRWLYLLDVSGGVRGRSREFTFLEGLFDDDGRDRVRALHSVYRTKLEIDAHYTLQWMLRAWLVLHAPPALVLIALVAVHVFTVLAY